MNLMSNEYKKGILSILVCYLIWGSFPIYWYPLKEMDPFQLMAQRIGWSVLFLSLLVIINKQTDLLKAALFNRRIVMAFMASATLLFTNWSVYLWAITENHLLDASLGYYINPLVSIFLGRIFLKEPLTKTQYSALSIVFLGVLWLVVIGRSIPYVALTLAFSFGFYALIKKTVSLKTIPGLFIETLFMLPFSIIYLCFEGSHGRIEFFNLPTLNLFILLFSGVVTTIPLLLFSEGAKRIPLTLVGIIQYISPTLQLLIGLLIFKETFTNSRLLGFVIVWIGIIIFILGEWRRQHPRTT